MSTEEVKPARRRSGRSSKEIKELLQRFELREGAEVSILQQGYKKSQDPGYWKLRGFCRFPKIIP